MDARYWGVPQRRRRIALVVDYGGSSAPEILFDETGERWTPAADGPVRPDTAGGSGSSPAVIDDQGGSWLGLADIVPTLRAETHGNLPVFCLDSSQAKVHVSEELAATLTRHKDPQWFCFRGNRSLAWLDDNAPTLTGAKSGTAQKPLVTDGYTVRRITPLEAERCQGLPDGYTNIPGASDTARYRAIGNAIALPQWRFVLDGIYRQLSPGATLGSLFDGISCFPWIWRELRGRPLWACEIDPFCVRVSEYHFGEGGETWNA
jgi:DNA (cytosine-5)-methyltransferase 1